MGPYTISLVRLRIPSKARSAYNDAVLDYRKEKLAAALKHAEKALNIYPTFPDALLLRGVIRSKGPHPEEGEEDMRASLNLDPTFSLSYVVLANYYNASERFGDALKIMQQGIVCCSMSWKGYYELARAKLGMREYDAVLATIEQSEIADPTPQPLLHLIKGHALAGLKKYHAAIAELSSYLKGDPHGEGAEQTRLLLEQIRKMPSSEAGE